MVYSNSTFGGKANTVIWFIDNDSACKDFVVASESQMTTSLTTARRNPLIDGTSKQFTYNSASLKLTNSQYGTGNCTGGPVNSSIQAANYGNCLSFPSLRIVAYVSLRNGTTLGHPASTTLPSSGASGFSPLTDVVSMGLFAWVVNLRNAA